MKTAAHSLRRLQSLFQVAAAACPIIVTGLLACLSVAVAQAEAPTSQPAQLNFEQHVRPILKAFCLDCHGGGEALDGNLDLRQMRLAAKGGDTGPALIAGKSAESLMLARMKAGEMPPGEKKVPSDQIAIFEQWISAGAPTLNPEPEQIPPGIDITPEERSFWSFQPIRRVEPPKLDRTVGHASQLAATPQADLVRTPIDAFILAKLREQQLGFAPDADRLTLVRRVALDLTGLPPTAAETAAYLNDTSGDAYEKMVDRYLQSPHYGERWGRHWLDIAGYAESDGNGSDDTQRPYAYKYRDYVIRSLNADKPLDQFCIEQLAGDELVPRPWSNLSAAQIDTLAATGFLRMAVDPTASGGDEALGANQVVADTLKIVSTSLLGLSVGCAQCHDHRYDPIPQADYYRLRAVFEPALNPSKWRRPAQRLVSLYTDADRARAAAVQAEVQTMQAQFNAKQATFLAAALDAVLLTFPEAERIALRTAIDTPAKDRSEAQQKLLAANPKVNVVPGLLSQFNQAAADELTADQVKIAAKQAEQPVEDFVAVLSEVADELPETHIFHRGDHRQPKAVVQPGDLTIAAVPGQRAEFAAKDSATPTSGRRLAFAKHLMSGQHPLVGRVLANRIWLHHFNRGLVETPSDFGMLGTRPTHPELLDWLASELPRSGWSLKQMHKLILSSTVYRQSSRCELTGDAAETAQRLYGRFPLRRLDAEILRDRILTASGKLDLAMFGPAIKVAEDFSGQVVTPDDQLRRSIYLEVRRTKQVSFLATFDAPIMSVNCDRRVASTGAPQSLLLMNSEFVLKQAQLFAQRVRGETPPDFAAALAAPFAAKLVRHSDAWQYGYGAVDEITQRVASFTPLGHFTGSAWQAGLTLPDAQGGWAMLHASGGHAGNDLAHATIRRWVAKQEGTLKVSGKLRHPAAGGDGVRGRIVSSRAGVLGQWVVKTGEAVTDLPPSEIRTGDTIDFVVDCNGDVNSDSFEWVAVVERPADTSGGPDYWSSLSHFAGNRAASLPQQLAYAWQLAFQRPPSAGELELACQFVNSQAAHLQASGDKTDHELTALTNLCQQLLSSNEFLYGD